MYSSYLIFNNNYLFEIYFIPLCFILITNLMRIYTIIYIKKKSKGVMM